jgi:N-hydroxyarylamine O-acetyltransferase
MDLTAYLDRIQYHGSLEPTLETLTALHRAHLYNIPYENLDIHLGNRLIIDEDYIFDKIVNRKRGGWCYEMNGLFAWALGEMGFQVTKLASDVGTGEPRNEIPPNHLILRVDFDRPYLADVGFGNGILEPIPLEVGTYQQDFYTYQLTRVGDDWYFINHPHGGPGFYFRLQPYPFSHFADRCEYLQTSPESGFVQTTVCFRFVPKGVIVLRGAVLRTTTATGVIERTIESQAEYDDALYNQFGLDIGDSSALWQNVWQRHLDWMNEQKT